MAEYRYSSTIGLSLCISSMKRTSLGSRFVNNPAKSPGLSKTGPEVTFRLTPNSFATMWAKVVFPKPGGPWNKVWSKASDLWLHAWTKILKLFKIWSCPAKSSKLSGLRALSSSTSSFVKLESVGSKFYKWRSRAR